MGSDDWVSINGSEFDPADDAWELLESDDEPLRLNDHSINDLLWSAIEDHEIHAILPDHIISKYPEGTLSLHDLERHAFTTISFIIHSGIERTVEYENLWSYYGGPALIRSASSLPSLGLAAFRLAAALELEGVAVDEALTWSCESVDLKEVLRTELRRYRNLEWTERKTWVSSTRELNEEIVRHAFAARVPEECVSIFGENTVIAHRVYRQALIESLGRRVPVLHLSLDRSRTFSQSVTPVLEADILSLRLGKISIDYVSESSVIDWLATLNRQQNLFQWCEGDHMCLSDSLRDDQLLAARAMGRMFAIRTVSGIGWGMKLPEKYWDSLLKPAPVLISNRFLEAIRQGFSEIVSLDHVGGFRELAGGPREAISRSELKAASAWDGKERTILNFWKLVDMMTEIEFSKLLMKLTGSRCLNADELSATGFIKFELSMNSESRLRLSHLSVRMAFSMPKADLKSQLFAAINA